MVVCLYPTSFAYLVHSAELKPEKLKLAASKLLKSNQSHQRLRYW